MSTRQLFANLTSGEEKQKKRGANRKGSQDHFHALGKNLYLSISFLTSLPLLSLPRLLLLLLLPHQLPSLFHPAGRNKRVHTHPSPPPSTVPCCLNFLGDRKLKLHSVAAIVRVIRKSYLQRVRVARAETAGGRVADGARVCACLEGCEVWLERSFFFFPSASPSNAWNYTCHLPACLLPWCVGCADIIAYCYSCLCAQLHLKIIQANTYSTSRCALSEAISVSMVRNNIFLLTGPIPINSQPQIES